MNQDAIEVLKETVQKRRLRAEECELEARRDGITDSKKMICWTNANYSRGYAEGMQSALTILGLME